MQMRTIDKIINVCIVVNACTYSHGRITLTADFIVMCWINYTVLPCLSLSLTKECDATRRYAFIYAKIRRRFNNFDDDTDLQKGEREK